MISTSTDPKGYRLNNRGLIEKTPYIEVNSGCRTAPYPDKQGQPSERPVHVKSCQYDCNTPDNPHETNCSNEAGSYYSLHFVIHSGQLLRVENLVD